MQYLSIIRFVIGLSFLLVASISDIKTRRVSDVLWIIMSVVASSILAMHLILEGVGWRYYLIFIPVVVLLSYAFVEIPELYTEKGLNPISMIWLTIPLISSAYQIHHLNQDIFFWSLMVIPVTMVFVFVLYYFSVIYGGADAKAVLVIAILVPFYPEINGLTNTGLSPDQIPFMQIFFPFTFIVLLNASLIMLVLPIYFLSLNLKRGDKGFPQMLFGYKKPIDEIPDSFVWPMERYDEKGNLNIKLFPRDEDDDVLNTLISKGRERVWVTPKIPFIVPLCIGYIISFLIGNPISYLL